ncbi:hypothetical protein [Alicyclobacillus sp. SO9]|uniref:hypothetical protein n=1 Tax=Alicyclobacillus sp. SO9 TaxID=2665646 RepID=UPI0018E88772|nr:hypothetical protein [Alicyclobacillus sp. SO9]QQE77601.1 hypothetical protein GI364_16870 [Alicyclobacillus sp. SO9]
MTTAAVSSRVTLFNQAIRVVCKRNVERGRAELCTYDEVATYLNNGYQAYEMYLNNGCNPREIAECLMELREDVHDWWRVVGHDGFLETEPAALRSQQYDELKHHGFQFDGPNVILQ